MESSTLALIGGQPPASHGLQCAEGLVRGALWLPGGVGASTWPWGFAADVFTVRTYACRWGSLEFRYLFAFLMAVGEYMPCIFSPRQGEYDITKRQLQVEEDPADPGMKIMKGPNGRPGIRKVGRDQEKAFMAILNRTRAFSAHRISFLPLKAKKPRLILRQAACSELFSAAILRQFLREAKDATKTW